MAVRVLLVLAAFAVLYGCGQTSTPVKSVKEPTTPETTPPTPPPVPEPTHTPASVSAGMSDEEKAAQAEVTCRLANYVSNENLTMQQASALSKRVANWRGKKMQEDPSLSAGRAENAALDDLGVPRYPECKVGGE